MKQELERYLNDHLAGATGALLVIQHLADHVENPEARDFFIGLKAEVQADRDLLEDLLASAGLNSSTILKIAGDMTARLGLMKLMWEGTDPGELGLFEALEMLALGVQGKRLLWLALREITPWFPEWNGHNFAELELKAIQQRDGIERWRIEAAREALPPIERRSAAVKGSRDE
jgi:hypothetical protein